MPRRSSASSHPLTDHEQIRAWAEERGARPSSVRGTRGAEDIGMIRFDFPGYSGEDSLQEISWDDWFRKFDDNNLALLVQETTANGQESNFNKLVSRANLEEPEAGAGIISPKSHSRDSGQRKREAGPRSRARTSAKSKFRKAGSRTSSRSSGRSSRSSRSGRQAGASTGSSSVRRSSQQSSRRGGTTSNQSASRKRASAISRSSTQKRKPARAAARTERRRAA